MAQLLYYQQHKVKVILDLLGTLFLFGLGIGGLIFVSNPIEGLIPAPPMLTIQDWTGSTSYSGIEEERYPSQPIDKRQFMIRMHVGGSYVFDDGAEIWQRAVWYAESTEVSAAWERRDSRQSRGFFNKQPIMTTHLEEDQLESVLFCDNYHETGLICAYYAHSGYWYTEVWFWSGGDSWLSLSMIETLIKRVDKLLLSAPPTPEKYGIFN